MSKLLQTEEQRKEANDKRITLAAFEDKVLSVEAQEQLLRMQEDREIKHHRGRDLPTVTKADLLSRGR